MTAPTSSRPDSADAYYEEAWGLICTGERPTADKLVARLGGSKATAVSALRVFWATELPQRMQAQYVVAPTKIHEIAARLWTEAQKLARDEADDALADARAELERERAALQAERQAFADREQTHAAELAAARREVAEQTIVARELRDRVADLERGLVDVREQRDRLTRTAESLERLVAANQEKHDALRTQLEARLGTLAGALQQAEAQAAAAQNALATAQALADRVPALEQEVQAARERADAAVREVSVSMAEQHKAALDAVQASHEKVVHSLQREVDAARTETAKLRDAGAAAEKALRQRLARLEATTPKRARHTAKKQPRPA